jgi:peptide/nickel transport system permease protein
VGRYIARRLLIAVPTLVAISFVVYVILALAPIDPLASFGADPRVPPEVRERIRESLGLNDPWPVRYVKWLGSLVTGNFGYSFMSHSPVIELIQQRLPNTLAVVGVAYVVGLLIGVPTGMLAAVRRNSILDHAISTVTYAGFSVPTFFTGLLLIIVFAVKLHWLPFIYNSNLKITDLESLTQQLRQSIMPIAVLGLFNAAVFTRYVRSEMLEHLPLDYVRTARSKGMHERLVVIFNLVADVLYAVLDPRIRYS